MAEGDTGVVLQTKVRTCGLWAPRHPGSGNLPAPGGSGNVLATWQLGWGEGTCWLPGGWQ